jgi:anion-transporting  ArsA/GET3 family ATPase
MEFATHTAPGLKDILLIGKIKEAENRRHSGAYVFDLIVVDAPPTGRLPRFLEAPRAVAELVHGGPIRTQAQGVLDMVIDPKRSQVVLVTLPEEMPVRETAEAAETLQKMGVGLAPMVVNGVYPPIAGLGRSPAKTLRAAATSAGLTFSDDAIASLTTVAGVHARRATHQRALIEELASGSGQPIVELPFLFTERIGRAEIDSLGAILEESGAL